MPKTHKPSPVCPKSLVNSTALKVKRKYSCEVQRHPALKNQLSKARQRLTRIMAQAGGYTPRSILQKFAEDHLQCSICHELYREPKTLKCLHSFCRHCLKRCHKYKASIPCPICRVETSTPGFTVRDLPSDFRLVSMVEAVKKDDTEKVVAACKNHPRRKRCIFCDTCDEMICLECLKESHGYHEVWEACEEVVGKKATIRQCMKQCQESLTSVMMKLDDIAEVKSDFEGNLDEIDRQLDVRADAEIARIVAAKIHLKDQIDQIQTEKDKIFTQSTEDLLCAEERFEALIDDCKNALKINNGYQFLVKYRKVKSDFKFVQESQGTSEELNRSMSVQFVPSTKSTFDVNLGTIIVHNPQDYGDTTEASDGVDDDVDVENDLDYEGDYSKHLKKRCRNKGQDSQMSDPVLTPPKEKYCRKVDT